MLLHYLRRLTLQSIVTYPFGPAYSMVHELLNLIITSIKLQLSNYRFRVSTRLFTDTAMASYRLGIGNGVRTTMVVYMD